MVEIALQIYFSPVRAILLFLIPNSRFYKVNLNFITIYKLFFLKILIQTTFPIFATDKN